MNIDKNELGKLLEMSENEFRQKVDLISQRLGMPTQSTPSNSEKIRSMLRSMSEKDIEQLLSSLGAEKTNEIIKILEGGR